MISMIKNFFRQHEYLSVFLLFFIIELFTIGINIPRLGFYHDDWYLLWSGAARGSTSIISLFSTDRPFMGIIYSYTYRLIGDNIILWHVYAFFLRLLGGFTFYAILRRIFPDQPGLNFLMVSVFYVYPGFLSQPDANTKQNHLLGYEFAILSIYLSVVAVQTKEKWKKIISTFFAAVFALGYLFIYEYMIGLEITRIIFIGFALFKDNVDTIYSRVISALKTWILIPLVTIFFLYWRFFIFDSSRSATNIGKLEDSYLNNIQAMGYRLIFQTLRDFFDITFFAWFVEPYSLIKNADNTDLFIGLLFGFSLGLISFLWVKHHNKLTSEIAPQIILVAGLIIILSAIFPVILANREFDPNDAYKSYGLHPTMGVALVVGGFAAMVNKNYHQIVIISIFVISVTTQYLNGVAWVEAWELQKSVWWQLTWRAPDLLDETLLVIRMPDGYRFRENYEIFGPVNLIYRPGQYDSPPISAEIPHHDLLTYVSNSEIRQTQVRDIPLTMNYSRLLLGVVPNKDACLNMLNSSDPFYPESTPSDILELMPYTNSDNINTHSTQKFPPTKIFGEEPNHGWCYYFQKASLAYQDGNWAAIADYYQQVKNQELSPIIQEEWLPFIGGLLNYGDADEATKLYKQTVAKIKRFEVTTCQSINDPNFTIDIAKYGELINLICK